METINTELSRILADNLIHLRNQKGRTQRSVATDLALSSSTVAHAESGLGNPSMALIVMLANYYKVTVNDLLYDRFDLKRVIYRRGEWIFSQASESVSTRLILSHQSKVRVREFSMTEGAKIRLAPGKREWQELLFCQKGQVVVSGFAQTVTANPGQFFELVPYVEKKIWSMQGESVATLIQIKK